MSIYVEACLGGRKFLTVFLLYISSVIWCCSSLRPPSTQTAHNHNKISKPARNQPTVSTLTLSTSPFPALKTKTVSQTTISKSENFQLTHWIYFTRSEWSGDQVETNHRIFRSKICEKRKWRELSARRVSQFGSSAWKWKCWEANIRE